MKSIDELRDSPFHQELAHKLWAAFVAQQQGISMNTALKKTDPEQFGERISDAWLIVAEIAIKAYEDQVACLEGGAPDDQLTSFYRALCVNALTAVNG